MRRGSKSVVAVPMAFIEPNSHTTRWGKQTLMTTLRVDNSWRQIYEIFLTYQEGNSNKFHYFGVWRDKTGKCVGGNAYGRIGYNPKAIEVARGSEGLVMSAVRGKVENKQRQQGYQVQEV